MTPYRELADGAWRWVLEQVHWDDGPWIPESVTGEAPAIPEYRDGMHSGIGGLAHALAEIKLARAWTTEEQQLATAIADRIRTTIPAELSSTYFDGLVSSIGVLIALDEPGSAAALQQLAQLATADGWATDFLKPPTYVENARANDATLGTAAVLMGALWTLRHDEGGRGVADQAATVLMSEMEVVPTGADWPFVPRRFRTQEGIAMPNFSHGLAGIAATLAVAGVELDRPELVAAARDGAEHLVTLGVMDERGFRVPRVIPWDERHGDEFTFNWCHGGAGTSLLFTALQYAGVESVAGESPVTWHRRCLDGVRYSGIPQRLHPGFWDNDGRCCGTAGVGDIFLDSWRRSGEQEDLDFAVRLADALVERAVRDESSAYWRFVEHRNEEPLLPPGVGWMQGAAGIAAYLFRIDRVLSRGRGAAAVARMDTWWSLG